MSAHEEDSDNENIVELMINDSGHISLSDITAATIGPLDADIWSSTDSRDHSPSPVHRPWAPNTEQPADQQQQEQQQQTDSTTDSLAKPPVHGSLQATHTMPQQVSNDIASELQQPRLTYYESRHHKTSEAETSSKRRRTELGDVSVKERQPVASYSYGALLQATSEHVPSNGTSTNTVSFLRRIDFRVRDTEINSLQKRQKFVYSHGQGAELNIEPSTTYNYDMLQKAMPDNVQASVKEVVTKPNVSRTSTIHYTPTTKPHLPQMTSYTALAQTISTNSQYDNKTHFSPISKTDLTTTINEVPSQYPSTPHNQTSYTRPMKSETQTGYNETWHYSSPVLPPITTTRVDMPRRPINSNQPNSNTGLHTLNVNAVPQGHFTHQTSPNVKTEFQPWVRRDDQSTAYGQRRSYNPVADSHLVAQSSAGKLVEDYYKNNSIFQQTDKYRRTANEHTPSTNTEPNVQQSISNYTHITPVTKRSSSLNDYKPIQGSPAIDSRFNDSLTNLLGSPPPDSPLSRNPFFGDLQDILAKDCRREIIPQTLFNREPEAEKDNVFKRERRLQERFESLKAKNPLDIHQLSSFYRYQSALIETERFRSLHECQYPASYKESLNRHYDNKIFSVMDRVEQSVLLLENANKENKPANQIAKPRPHLSKEAIYVMEEWYVRNTDHPYPTSMTIEALAQAGNIGVEQVKKWFANKRNRSHNTRTLTEIAMKKRKLGHLASQS